MSRYDVTAARFEPGDFGGEFVNPEIKPPRDGTLPDALDVERRAIAEIGGAGYLDNRAAEYHLRGRLPHQGIGGNGDALGVDGRGRDHTQDSDCPTEGSECTELHD